MKVLVGFILCLIILAVGGVIYIYSGSYNVSVSNRDDGLIRWIMETTVDNSVEHHAKVIDIPSLDDSTMILRGYVHYSRMCSCHGSPGHESNKSFNPEPPELYRTVGDLNANELFWIIKNGIKMSAMPSYAERSSDDEIWDIVSFVRTLPKITPEEYKTMDSKAKKAGFIEKEKH
jgi:hypothetical protein